MPRSIGRVYLIGFSTAISRRSSAASGTNPYTLTRTRGNLELALYFLRRVPLWPVEWRDARLRSLVEATAIPVLDRHELSSLPKFLPG